MAEAAAATQFVTYVAHVNPITANAQTEILANIDLLIAAIPFPGDQNNAPRGSNFDLIPPAVAMQLRRELLGLKTVIDATAVA